MKVLVMLLVVGCAVSTSLTPHQTRIPGEAPCCKIVEAALEESRNIKSGTTRREIEKKLKLDGGVQSPKETRYLFPDCNDIKIEIEFEHHPNDPDDPHSPLSPNDTVSYVHIPYLEYPAST
jgi:hypothetical protein